MLQAEAFPFSRRSRRMIERTAGAVWNGGIQDGSGTVRVGSGTFEERYSFSTRFGGEQGTNPEELIGAAHAACFSMALSGILGAQKLVPERISTRARVEVEKGKDGFTIQRIHLSTRGVVPGLDAERFRELAEEAKATCPVSRALAGVGEISLETELLESDAPRPVSDPGMLM